MKETIRKIVSLLLVLTLFALVAMGSGSSSSDDSKNSNSSQAGSSVSSDSSKGDSSSNKADEKVTVEERVLFEGEGVKITLKDLDMDGWFGPEVKLLIENEREEDITVYARNVTVNGYMIENLMAAEVAAGKKTNDELTLMSSDLKTAGITTIADIELSFHIIDDETWDTIVDTDRVRIETSAAPGFQYSYEDSGTPVYDKGGIKIVVKGFAEEDSLLGPSLVMFITNESGEDVTIFTDDVSANGFMIDPLFYCDILDGMHAYDTMTFSSSQLEENSIETIEELEFSIRIVTMEHWNTIDESDPVSITFE